MELIFSIAAKKELENLSPELKAIFFVHLEKIRASPPRKHMQHGISCHVEKVTKQARIIYSVRGDQTYVLHCFANHKDYEHWYKSYK
jgi:plasmid maintenance system killer protein